MNIIFLSGRLTRDPEMRKTQSGTDVCSFSVAVDRPGTTKENRLTDYFDCTVWGGKDGPGRAGVIEKYFHKGDGIVLNGVMQSRKFQDKQGNDRIGWSVRVDDFEFPLSRKGDGAQQTQTAPSPAPEAQTGGEFVEVEKDELPF